jgi:hypothetical protein
MRLSKIAPRAMLSALVAVALITVFSLSSFAAPNVVEIQDPGVVPVAVAEQGGVAGTLVVNKGSVNINGNSVQTGATVLSASRIVTGSNGLAVIDLGPQGRIEIRDDTTVTLTYAPGMVHIKAECDEVEIEVTRGQVDVKLPEIKAIVAGEDETYDDMVEATTNGSTDLIIDCGDHAPAFILAGWWGVAGLVGLAVGITTGIVVGGPDSGPRRVSPII